MNSFRKWNLITGWLVFIAASLVYILTLEPTVSFWDCGEFISAGYRLQIMHPPGAPLFGLVVRMFTLFASSPETVAWWANLSSALCSSFTILFLFWSITHLGRKIYRKKEHELNSAQILAVLGAGVVGALAYTFSDSFWFSAVETEVYAMSSLITAIVFWAILKWENVADEPGADRWLVFIAFLMGLSVTIHLLSLLALPAMAYIYYFKKFKVTRKGFIYATLISIGILGVFNALAPTLARFGALFDRVFVNGLGLPFNSGLLVFTLLVFAAIGFGIVYARKKGRYTMELALACLGVAVLGCSLYGTTVIRSLAEPSIDMNDPEDAYSLLFYINREQYGDRPLLYGNHFAVENGQVRSKETNKTVWTKVGDKYIDAGKKTEREFDDEANMIFPRMYSFDQGHHVRFYRSWLGLKENQKPTFADNIRFFWTYQMGHMYWRYFMWNFSGRQNNEQGHGELQRGNWISGIKFLDEARLGPQDHLPRSIADNPAHNKFYMLPFILGLIGLVYQVKKHKKDALVTGLLFFFTGIAIVIYLNQYPYQPRERDYAYVGSFYAFCIWIGLGVMAITEWIQKYIKGLGASAMATLVCLSVPGIMAAEGWDDHNRSNRYTARDIAKDYLDSCAPNAILFTMGDNDTYPLWYVQEVEGYRTDVRVVNLSLLGTSWYAEHMKLDFYDGKGVPFSIPLEKYYQGKRDYVPVYDMKLQGHVELKDAMEFILSDDPRTKAGGQSDFDYVPTKKLGLTIDKEKILSTGTVAPEDSALIVSRMEWEIPGGGIYKHILLIYDLLNNNNWERPVYFATTIGNIGSRDFAGLDKYFRQDGMTYRVVPIENTQLAQREATLNVPVMYENMMEKFVWGNMNGDISVDPETYRMSVNLRSHFYRLARELYNRGDNEKCKAAILKGLEVLPDDKYPFEGICTYYIELLYKVGAFEEGNQVARKTAENALGEAKHYAQFKGSRRKIVADDLNMNISILQRCVDLARRYGQQEILEQYEASANELVGQYVQ